jgi:hypothetical protein
MCGYCHTVSEQGFSFFIVRGFNKNDDCIIMIEIKESGKLSIMMLRSGIPRHHSFKRHLAYNYNSRRDRYKSAKRLSSCVLLLCCVY